RSGEPGTWQTATGELRQFQLDDGSQLYLNTATRVTLDFSDARRRVVLRAGEILMQVHQDQTSRAMPRPFVVSTPHGD
ncbi:FecR domain-containing protein, partial [Campylobacter lari]|nr:FecR domain-containing protein [Campylobacter lari]